MKSMPFYNFYNLLSGFSNLPQEAMLISILLFNFGEKIWLLGLLLTCIQSLLFFRHEQKRSYNCLVALIIVHVRRSI